MARNKKAARCAFCDDPVPKGEGIAHQRKEVEIVFCDHICEMLKGKTSYMDISPSIRKIYLDPYDPKPKKTERRVRPTPE